MQKKFLCLMQKDSSFGGIAISFKNSEKAFLKKNNDGHIYETLYIKKYRHTL